ncbi:MAG: hypothetical protein A2268_05935 [Candidatus Raymondbacteria bacterium RifOxyA12_full_50_37]|uniref:PPM-type phosphatase domain-containing protein n=1 Tax=Candidatus Raymondbacteria bacterium RIFOXYD12_FULL_49_13 TaxID=1817890 RepID=A0A1F7FFE6_UNCRA|nr:MAG: hypothetical protein A2268_05935 [Candidatus Raymondbacteria bacterium RifOxyA12_full_50_37]OGJ94280.1 MAG: hypothetical protein A2248_14865 [Candidatus Raymondbacteria bacterium RIFOXYA2_FULL_49_16]OGJ96391.1 MAG: hypothetical protein A2487_00465 [Candidatus Raymondbacteria bacterium RifOxyC12_full_50_8]OGJ99110.1 MAG: hypothetical protein A2453_11275 [Candidatus Raymondbacteria bacterium RIFOXYC2_FULL_50_21]OGK05415.1 MAG: hypothetical protein A2519_03190 [Candidatus Raymondbacteria b
MTQKPATEIDLLRQQNEQLKSQLMATSVITEITKVMMSTPDLASVFRTMMLGIHDTMEFERIILFKVDPEGFVLRPVTWTGIPDALVKDLAVPLSFIEGGDIADTIFLNRPIFVDPVSAKDDPMGSLSPRSYLTIPIVTKSYTRCHEFHNCTIKECPAYNNPNPYCWTIQGSNQRHSHVSEDERRRLCVLCPLFKCNHVLWMDRPSSETLATSEDITVLSTLASQAGLILDNFQTYEDLKKANKELQRINVEINKINHDLKVAHDKINKDLEQAQEIQLSLLPQNLPKTERFSCAATYVPATKVGGDYYDLFQIGDGIYCMLVADVSGHGMAAALIMSMVKILIKSHTNIHSTRETLSEINRVLNQDIKTDNFVTMFYAILNLRENMLTYSSAGHNPILIIDKATRDSRQIKAEGIFLGVFDDAMVKDNVMPLKENHRMILYTDGLTEAENMSEEMYSLERLESIAKKTVNLSPEDAQTEIIRDFREFTGKAAIADDVTLMILDIN